MSSALKPRLKPVSSDLQHARFGSVVSPHLTTLQTEDKLAAMFVIRYNCEMKMRTAGRPTSILYYCYSPY